MDQQGINHSILACFNYYGSVQLDPDPVRAVDMGRAPP
jgi:hypothetical protein